MFRLMKRILLKENGQALPLIIIMLALCGSIVAPVLDYTTDSLKSSANLRNASSQIYSAESGLMEAIWELKFDDLVIADNETYALPLITINGDTVNTTIARMSGPVCEIVARTVTDDGADTLIRALVYVPDAFIPATFDNITGSFVLGDNENYIGNISVEGNVSLGFGSVIYGHIDATGNIFLETDARVVGDIRTDGEIFMSEDCHVEGTVISEDNVEIGSDSSVGGDVCTGGNLVLHVDASVHGNIYVANNATLNDDATVQGDAFIGGSLKLYGGAEIFGDYPLGYGGCDADLGDKGITRIMQWEITRCE